MTFLQSTFPEHRHMFEQTRHKIGHFFGSLHDDSPPIYNKPRADVRETAEKYYIDVEVPGLESKEKLVLKWTNTRLLLIEATIDRPPIEPPSKEAEKSEAPAAAVSAAPDTVSQPVAEADPAAESEATETKKSTEEKKEIPVHLTVHERRVGKFLRTFSFPVGVDHHSVLAQLQHGLLRLIVNKLPDPVEHKEIVVEHVPFQSFQ